MQPKMTPSAPAAFPVALAVFYLVDRPLEAMRRKIVGALAARAEARQGVMVV